jgi:hypothetical protein
MNATIQDKLIPVRSNIREDGSKWITVELVDGWNTCKKICKKVLEFNGENYVFRGWNSDRNEAFFIQSNEFARIK